MLSSLLLINMKLKDASDGYKVSTSSEAQASAVRLHLLEYFSRDYLRVRELKHPCAYVF